MLHALEDPGAGLPPPPPLPAPAFKCTDLQNRLEELL